MESSILLISQASSNQFGNYFTLISQASVVVKGVLLVLALFSIISWAIVIFKLLEYKTAKKKSGLFLEIFRKTKSFSEILKFTSIYKESPLSEIFKSGYKELSMQFGPEKEIKNVNPESLRRAMFNVSNLQIMRLERLNGFLATTAAVTPFIGLFGTVWGIMSSFHQIGIQMNANLATVAPGIAEALIATALGLFAAIPAVIFYNLLLNKVKVMIVDMENFINEFISVSEHMN
ncbi:MAG: MotA/TolQ/ExbB proton channel family protein [Candidatus Aminicenantes bacterium]|nr:MotA/TolQ/ExbB proton channel family protein [Candidatus Aminicenantes bacterium]